ncbi:MAG: hypothetical protein IPK01_11125 [Acidobacteria bacterium]|nr:hypothetical protein [Acidobacteriota bacterium]
MNRIYQFTISLVLLAAFMTNALPCGPGYISPVFDQTKAPENPYANYAAGRLGIIKTGFNRSILFAAYRYLNGGSFSADDQRLLVELWKAEVDRDYPQQDDVGDAVKAWVAQRKVVLEKEEKPPEIYVERSYGGYDFFPNCTKNAFEVAAETLSNRISEHGATDSAVANWVAAQDQVFKNCAAGKQAPDDAPMGAPVWLQKDRAYQKAAAEFYSLDYANAKKHFAEIAQDTESPWAETADYLVARTLIRRASLSPSAQSAKPYYEEAEIHLERFVSKTGKFAASADRMLGLIKYRLHPKERVGELAKTLSYRSGNDNFKQDLIDYTWLLDKFESEAIQAEEKRKIALAAAKAGNTNTVPPANTETETEKVPDDGMLQINLYSESYAESWSFKVKPEATDAELIAAAEKAVGKPLTDAMKKSVRESKQLAYASRFSDSQRSDYEGGYYTEEELNLSALPAFLRNDDLTDWLFTFQTRTPEAYLYSLKRFRESGSELWLMTAISKAERNSTDVARLLEAANNTSRTSTGYQTIGFHQARLLIDLGKTAEAKTLIDDVLAIGDDLPISTRNNFLDQRRRITESLDDFLRFSLRKPYAWDFSGDVGSIDELIAKEKMYYDPEYHKDGQEAYNKEVEDRYKEQREWQSRDMLDTAAIDLMNRTFPQPLLIEVERSEALPDYLRAKFVVAIWTRAYLLDDTATLLKMTPEMAKHFPDLEPQLEKITAATTQAAQDRAILYFILKNPLLSPYIEDGIGKSDNEFGDWDSNDWWCSSYLEADEPGTDASEEVDLGFKRLPAPKFLTAAQRQAAIAERKKLIALGDAPEMLGKRVIDWAKRFPTDKRVPEALYIVQRANGWTKYGCGSNEDLQAQITAIMKKSFPSSEWTRKLESDESEKSQ